MTEEILELGGHFDALCVYAYKKCGKTEEQAMSYADALGTYHDIDDIDQWVEIIEKIVDAAKWKGKLPEER